MKLKYMYELIDVEGQRFAVPLEGSGGIIKLSRTAAVIFELLQNETTEEEIVEKMEKRYDAGKDIIEEDVRNLVTNFREKGLLV